MNILFDSMGVQVQVQNETKSRLTTLFGAIAAKGWNYSFSNYQQPLSQQLSGIDVLVILTHQFSDAPGYPPAIPAGTNFAFPQADLLGIPAWVLEGNGLLLISNHGGFFGAPPYFPVNDTLLAQKFDITIVPAAFSNQNETTDPLTMPPLAGAPPCIVNNVSTVVAHDSCGISAPNGTPLFAIPSTATDLSGLGYNPSDYSFAVYQETEGGGGIIVAGNSGITGNTDSTFPAPGMIAAGSNEQFLLNCISCLVSTVAAAPAKSSRAVSGRR